MSTIGSFCLSIGDVLDQYDVDCWDACVMPNHYHLAVMNHQPNLPEAMQHLNGEYAIWWNARHGKVGHTFQGRYKDQIVQREGYLLNLLRYVALNPVRAGLVTSPELWPWSAYPCTAGFSPNPGFLQTDYVLAQFGVAETGVLRERYVKHVCAPLATDNASYEEFRSRKRVLGDREFKSSVLSRLTSPTADSAMETHVALSDTSGFR